MRRLSFCLTILCLLTLTAPAFAVADAEVIKVLPQFLDTNGLSSLSPSLYERDAYQAWLRKHPAERSGLQLAVQWKAAGVDWSQVKLRAELRGVTGNTVTNITLEMPVQKTGLFSSWTELKLVGADFKKLGELAAWRVTLWEGDKQLAEMQSFLWSGVDKGK
jgi:cobalamin-dependent methionine synthase I